MATKSVPTKTVKKPCLVIAEDVQTIVDVIPYKLSPKLIQLTSNRASAETLLRKAGILDSTGELAVQYAR